MRKLVARLLCIIAVCGMPGLAFADEWIAQKLRGTVMVLVDGAWVKLERGALIPDDRVIRTMGGRITLTRGAETIELGPNTQIQIFDKEGRKPFTRVKEYFGRVAVEAEVREVQHFAVQTPHLVAVVKGTRFVVISDETSSAVDVERGSVAVQSTETQTNVLLGVGQSAEAGLNMALEVSGKGELPAVLDASGKPVQPGAAANAADAASNAGGNAGNGGGNAGNGGGNAGNGGGNAGGNSGNGGGNSGNDGGNSGNGGGNSGSASLNAGGNSANAGVTSGGNSGKSVDVSVGAGGNSVTVSLGLS